MKFADALVVGNGHYWPSLPLTLLACPVGQLRSGEVAGYAYPYGYAYGFQNMLADSMPNLPQVALHSVNSTGDSSSMVIFE